MNNPFKQLGGLIFLLLGAGTMFAGLWLQKISGSGLVAINDAPLHLWFFWASIEEIVKFAPLFLFARWIKRENILRYAILIALGFAYAENVLHFWPALLDDSLMFSWQRFIFANQLHIVATFFTAWFWKQDWRYLPVGLFLAVAAHFFFNVMNESVIYFFGSVLVYSIMGLLPLGFLYLCYKLVRFLIKFSYRSKRQL